MHRGGTTIRQSTKAIPAIATMNSVKGRQTRTRTICIDELDNSSSSSISSSSTVSSMTHSSYINDTFLPHLEIGENGTSKDMMIVSNRAIAFKMANSLQTHDFAFVLRSNGQWTYAMVAHRGPIIDTSSEIGSSSNDKGQRIDSSSEDAILFVVDPAGSTKRLTKKYWSTCIRMVNSATVSSLIDMLRPPACRKEDTIRYLSSVFGGADNLRKNYWANPTQLKNLPQNMGNQPPTTSLVTPLPRGARYCGRFPALIEDLPAPPFAIEKRRLQCVHFVQDASAKSGLMFKCLQNDIEPPSSSYEPCPKEACYFQDSHLKCFDKFDVSPPSFVPDEWQMQRFWSGVFD